MSGWGCPHEDKGQCVRLGRPCRPGMRGCVMHGRFRFAEPEPEHPVEADDQGSE